MQFTKTGSGQTEGKLNTKACDLSLSAWAGLDSSSMMVCTGALGETIANASSCACSGWAFLRVPCTRQGCNSSNHGDDETNWYCEVGPGADRTAPIFGAILRLITANCIVIDHFSAFESGSVAPFLYAA
eukprot:COSAG06_NODE_809_length_12164_cov_17.936179_14_plen_129_part_00